MSNVILQLSAMDFVDDATLDLLDAVDAGAFEGGLDGVSELPLIAYDLMLPLVTTSDCEVLPTLFTIQHEQAPARLAS